MIRFYHGSNVKHSNIAEQLTFASPNFKTLHIHLAKLEFCCVISISEGAWEQATERIQEVTEGLAAARETSVDAASAFPEQWGIFFCVKGARTKVAQNEVLHISVYNRIALETVLLSTAATHASTLTQNLKWPLRA